MHVKAIVNKELSIIIIIENGILWVTYPYFVILKQRNNVTADTINIINPTM